MKEIVPILYDLFQNRSSARRQWLTPIILAAQETEIRRILVRSQTRQIVCETLSQKKPSTKKSWWGEWLKV
jgi:murein endopeptidase